ncbi:MAG TPA: hypothetical protein VKR83_13320 [Ktedonobacteraceae bacterium]|nr:hypothetical protein [Ktedonobacteraceae bacterium]
MTALLILVDGDFMNNQRAFGEAVRSYLKEGIVTDRRNGSRFKPTQVALAQGWTAEETLSRKLNGLQPLYENDILAISATLIYWGCITHRSQLQHLFDPLGYTLPDTYWTGEPWKYLFDDTMPLKTPDWLPIQNASFEDWKNNEPTKWLCNTKTGWVKPVPGRTAGSIALEIGGNPDNQEWVYCRTRETQEIRVTPGSRISLSFWAKKTLEGKQPERSKYVEVFFHDGFQWVWGFGQDVTNGGDWAFYETEWWAVPVNVQKVSVGAVAFKDGAFQVDDIALRMYVSQ